MELNEIMGVLNSPDGLKRMMMKPAFEHEDGHEFSQADLIADVVNILRMDTKRMGEAVGVEVSVKKMTPERAAELLQGVANGTDLGLVDVFDEVEDKRMSILAEMEGEEAVDNYQQTKQGLLYTGSPAPEVESMKEPPVGGDAEGAEEVADAN